MYLGRIVEIAPGPRPVRRPAPPVHALLLAAVPVPDPARRRDRAPLEGDPPSPVDIPSGCRFRTRCPFAREICARDDPALAAIEKGGEALPAHLAACHFANALPRGKRPPFPLREGGRGVRYVRTPL